MLLWALGGKKTRSWFFYNSSPEISWVCRIMGSEVPRGIEEGQGSAEVVEGGDKAVLGLPSGKLGIYLLLPQSLYHHQSFCWKNHYKQPEDKLGSGSRWVWSKNNKTLGTVGSWKKGGNSFFVLMRGKEISPCSWAEVEISDSMNCKCGNNYHFGWSQNSILQSLGAVLKQTWSLIISQLYRMVRWGGDPASLSLVALGSNGACLAQWGTISELVMTIAILLISFAASLQERPLLYCLLPFYLWREPSLPHLHRYWGNS